MQETEDADLRGQSYSEDPREHIAQLSEEIGRMREEHGFAREPGADDVRMHSEAPAPASPDTEAVAGSVPSVCESTCEIKVRICRNAAKICKLAPELAGTDSADWANEKCDSGKTSCTEAKTQCEDCDD